MCHFISWIDLKGRGVHKECTDFSSPANFPDEIVKAIKSGAFKGMGLCPEILNQSASAEYEKINESASAEYEKINQSAFWCLVIDAKNRITAWV